MGIDIEKLLSKLQDSGDDRVKSGKGDQKNDMTETQQADSLLESFVAFSNPPALKPGDLVRYRKENSAYIRNSQRLHIVMGMLPEKIKVPVTDDNEGGPVAWRTYDVIVGVNDMREKGCVLKFLADSRDLEFYPDGDRLKKQGNA